ncbi:Nif3-like dinuclear metal center hexameric protein, partial [bacterium]|nr:Nif3-like dinuclear metal center hexameric protein [bacterium]
NKVMLCLSVTKNVIDQAKEQNCDLIISHHPLFFIPFELNQNIPVYSAHTNLDKAQGGTTDTIIERLGYKRSENLEEFVRVVEDNISIDDFILKLKIGLNLFNIRVSNYDNKKVFKKIAFCAGSGSEFESVALEHGADALVTGDVKYHTALDSKITLIDIGHFESEIPVVKTLANLLYSKVEVSIANETSPLRNF